MADSVLVMTGVIFSSPDGKFLLFLSAKCSVESGAHSATNSLHRIDWPMDGVLSSSAKITDVVNSSIFISFIRV